MRVIFALAFCFLASTVLAQSASRVRAIEHPNFSRLVIEVDPSTTWSSHQTGRETVLILNGVKTRLDASSLFDRMSRSRILNFSQSSGSQGLNIRVELGCDCEVIIDRLSGNQLAFDVWRQGSRPKEENGNNSNPVQENQTSLAAPSTNSVAPEPTSIEQEIESSEQEGLELAGSIAEEARLLEEEIARIADEGFLELDQRVMQNSTGAIKNAEHDLNDIYSGPDIPLTAPTHKSEIPFTDNGGQTRIGSTLLDAELDAPSAMSDVPTPAECKTYRVGNDDDGSQDLPVSDLLSGYRAGLINIDGSLNETAWRKLARFYVSIGFGTEAIAVLNELPNPDEPDAVLADMARIVEDIRPTGSLLFDSEYCSVELGIWRLASGRLPQEMDETVMLSELAVLPYAIRKSVGLMISRHVAQDFPEFAEKIGNLIDRTPDTEVPLSQEQLVQELAEEALLEPHGDKDQHIEKTAMSPVSEQGTNLGVTDSDAEQDSFVTRVGDPEIELDLGIAARQLSGTAPGLTATLTLAKYEAETGNVLDAITLLNQALSEYEFGSAEIYQTGTDLLLDSSQVKEFKAQFVLAALAGRKFLLAEEHQKIVEARIAELGLPNLTLF